MHITLLRHGKPDFEWERSIKGADLRQIEKEYDTSSIVGNPPEETLGLVNQHQCVVCSDFPRSIQSAKALGADAIHVSSDLFREMNPPYFDNASIYAPIKMPLKYWVIVLRGLWFLGFSQNTESFSNAKARARQASDKLIELAGEHHGVLFVGHGFLNHYVAKELLRRNWTGPRSPGNKYWDYATYSTE